MGQRVSLWEVSGASFPRLPGVRGRIPSAAGRISSVGSPFRVRSSTGWGSLLRFPSRGLWRREDCSSLRLLELGSPAPSPPSRGTGGWSHRGSRSLGLRSTSVLWDTFLAVRAPRDGALGLRWLFGSWGVLSFPSPARRSLTVRLPRSAQETGRLQGLAPPTSPVESESVLQLLDSLFLPWVCFPSEALSRNRVTACALTVGLNGLPCPIPAPVSSLPVPFPGDCSPRQGADAGPIPSVRFRGSLPSRVAASLGFSTSKSDCHDLEVRGFVPKGSALAALSVSTVSPDRKSTRLNSSH